MKEFSSIQYNNYVEKVKILECMLISYTDIVGEIYLTFFNHVRSIKHFLEDFESLILFVEGSKRRRP